MDNIDDEQNRKIIETEINTNLFVEAGAGSGKTTELVTRMIAMVESGIDVRQICAITFTKAAANEFYSRFQKELKDSKNPKAQEALKNIDLCFMGTIDSFTNMIISEHPAEACVPSDARVVDNNEMHEIWKDKLALIANGKLGPGLQEKYKLFVKYCKNSEEYFVRGMDFLANTKNVQFTYDVPMGECFSKIYNNEINLIKESLEFIVSNSAAIKQSSKTDKKALYFAQLALNLIDDFEANFESITSALKMIVGKNGIRFDKEVDLNNFPGMPKYLCSLFVQTQTNTGKPSVWIIKEAKDGGNPFFRREIDNFVYNIAMDFISSCVTPISNALKKEGKLSYSDYLFYLKEMLKHDASNGGKLIQHIYNRHKYYLIDEFQDTDPVQAEIFFYLTASNLNVAKTWKDCVPYPGSLFIVGDPKQSIYRFRNADVASYLNVKNLFENESVGRVVGLTKNFRSYKPMCDWFNETFIEMLQDKPGIQSAYAPIPVYDKKPYNGSFGGAKKQIYLKNSIKKSAATKNLVSIINEIVDNEKYTIEEPARKIEYKDIMVITYQKKHLKYYMDALRKNNIPYYVEGNVLFDSCPALKALSSLLNLIVAPQSLKAQTAVEFFTSDGMSAETAMQYNQIAKNLSPVSVASLLIDDQKIIGQCGTKNIEYLYYAIELLRAKENSAEVSTLSEAAKFISKLVSDDTDIERCLQFATDDNRVHLANLHKVKGLQAPVVIMTEAKAKNYEPDRHVNYMAENPTSCMFELKSGNYGEKLANWNNEKEKQLEAEILQAEKDRLLYVAATRAQSAFIATDFTLKNGGVSTENHAVNLLSHINEEIQIGSGQDADGNFIVDALSKNSQKEVINNREDVEKLYVQGFNERVFNVESLQASYKIERPSSAETKQINITDVKSQIDKERAAHIGTIVHRFMELRVLNRNLENANENCINQVVWEFAINNDEDINSLKKAAEECAPILDKINAAQEVYCEMPFTYKKDESTICDGVMDLVYKDADGWHIVDYKTNFDDRFLEIKYEKQLNAYKAALKQILDVDATTEIFHIAI